jgi:pimeloyl-ACP methyl ester carboxylesterase
MAILTVNGLDHYYEESGSGPPLVLIHGAFVDARLWDPQFHHLAQAYRVVRYDLRGHGRTGPSDLPTYTIDGFADDLAGLIEALGLEEPIICGLSLGGMIAQAYAVRETARLTALILADTAVSVSLTLSDKLQRYILFPKWAMQLTIHSLSAHNFTRFSFWLAQKTRSSEWFGQDEATANYVRDCMQELSDAEYLKIYDAIYGFGLQPLEHIAAPTLVLNGEHESRTVFRHTEEALRRIPQAESAIVLGAGHTSNMENPAAFNELVAGFLARTG